jgi:hypothetical protein
MYQNLLNQKVLASIFVFIKDIFHSKYFGDQAGKPA